jgi:hypothetical protein
MGDWPLDLTLIGQRQTVFAHFRGCGIAALEPLDGLIAAKAAV